MAMDNNKIILYDIIIYGTYDLILLFLFSAAPSEKDEYTEYLSYHTYEHPEHVPLEDTRD